MYVASLPLIKMLLDSVVFESYLGTSFCAQISSHFLPSCGSLLSSTRGDFPAMFFQCDFLHRFFVYDMYVLYIISAWISLMIQNLPLCVWCFNIILFVFYIYWMFRITVSNWIILLISTGEDWRPLATRSCLLRFLPKTSRFSVNNMLKRLADLD